MTPLTSILDLSSLRLLPTAERHIRFVALYTTKPSSPELRRVPLQNGHAIAELFDFSPSHASYREWLAAAAEQLPTIVDLRRHGGGAMALPAASAFVRPYELWTWTFDVQFAGFVLGIALDLELVPDVSLSDALPPLFEDLDTGREERRIQGQPLASLQPSDAPALGLGFDFHGVVTIPAGQAAEMDASDVQALVSRRWHLSRPRFITARLSEGGPFPDGVVAVTPGATVLGGIEDDMAMAMVICAAQAISAVAVLRDLQDEAFRAANEARRAQDPNASKDDGHSLGNMAERLAELDLDLSLAVERFHELRLFLPVWRVEQYHKLLLESLGIERATAVSVTMLSRVTAAVEARRVSLEASRWLRADRRQRLLSAIGGAVAFVAIPLTIIFSFLSVSVSPIGVRGSALQTHLLPYYAGIVGVLVIAALIGWLGVQLTRPQARR